MNFRSPNDTPIRIALTSGHTTIVGPEWQELPTIFHYDAVRCGCEQEDRPPPPAPAPVQNGPSAMNQDADPDMAYRAALTTMLERDEAKDFTGAGLPNTNVVSQLCGFSANKTDMLHVYRSMKAEAASEHGQD